MPSMTPERWQLVREVLEEVITVKASQRSHWLDEACGSDLELRHEVESLLLSHDRAGVEFLQTPAFNLLPLNPADNSPTIRVGRLVGVYRIEEQIGRGGMGEVYRAARVDGQYSKQVAVKLVRVGLDTSFVLERFRQERQILATLDHPNIARLLDGGTTEDGVPYFVMELIGGAPIDAYCDAQGLSVTERLELFLQVCAAVQHAHQRLIVHRDIKPSNIMVTREGGPKLLDFGIAKILDPAIESEPTLLRGMTPEYASPEQIRGEAITTATDVYSLGVVLYRILAGRSPYPENTRTPLEFAKVICEDEPARPSSRLTGSKKDVSGATAEISDHSVEKSRRQLKGDLDHIVLKALRKEPGRRYASVEQLGDDIRRHLKGLPVLAVKGSARYRAGKFIRRNRLALAAGTLVLVTLVAGITATIRQARIARRQAEIANAERARAEQRFKDVRELANSLIFEIHDSIQALPGATPSRKLLLDRAVQYLDKLSQDAAGDSNLQRELAWAYQRLATVQGDTTQSNLGEVGAAHISNGKAVALFEAVAKANPNNLTDQTNLAMAYRMRTLFDVFEPGGRAEIEKALAVTEPLMQTNANNLDLKNESAQEYYILALIQDIAGDRLQSISSFRKALALRLEILSANPAYPGIRQGVAKATVLLAHELGRFASKDEGLSLMNTAIADFQALQKGTGGDPGIVREVSAAQTRRGDIELMQGNVNAARADFQSAQRLIERLAKLDSENKMLQSDIWVAEFEEGRALAVAGRYTQALRLLQHAFEGYKSLHLEADVGPGPAAMQAWIGEAQAGMHDFSHALESYKAAAAGLAEDAPHYDDARCDLAMVETKIGYALLKMGKPGEAEAYYEKALATSNLTVSLERSDFPALYAAAEAYSGAGDVSAYEARIATDRATQSKLWNDACASYEKSLSIWKRISSRSRFGPNGYLSFDSQEIAQRLAASKAEVARSVAASNGDRGKM